MCQNVSTLSPNILIASSGYSLVSIANQNSCLEGALYPYSDSSPICLFSH